MLRRPPSQRDRAESFPAHSGNYPTGRPSDNSRGEPIGLFGLIGLRNSSSLRLGVAAGSMVSAIVLTHTFWQFLEHTPFLLGFAAAILSTRVGGRHGGFLALIIGVLGYASFPPPLSGGFGPLLFGFVVISGGGSWLIARRYEIEADLRASQERLNAVISNLPVILWAIDRDGCVTLSEGSGLDALDFKPRELVGRSVFDLYREVPEFVANTRRVLAGETFTATVALGEVIVETWFSPQCDDQGSVTGAIGVTINVTERRSLEAQLRQSHKMEAIGLMAGGIAHDFNNLLTAIGGYTEMVLETMDDSDARREDLNEVAKAATRAAALTRHLLAVSRRQILQPTVLDVNGMVTEVQKLLRRTIPENIDLFFDLNPTLEPVRADRGQLEQVVLNLAINAGDAMPQGGQLRLATDTVDIDEAWAHLHRPMPAGRYVRLTVTDTGTGMTQETQTHIFEPFFTTKEVGKGTGLGLATVYGIVKQSKGFIWVESRVGRGTRFEIYLPVVHEAVESPVLVAPAAHITGGSQTILLAEDDGAVRRLARDVLRNRGYTVLDARDGEEALAIARAYPQTIDLLIADVVMPGLSGRDLASRLMLERPDLRVLYTSGYTERVMMRAGFDRGLTLLAKPFLPGDLLRKVRETFEAAA